MVATGFTPSASTFKMSDMQLRTCHVAGRGRDAQRFHHLESGRGGQEHGRAADAQPVEEGQTARIVRRCQTNVILFGTQILHQDVVVQNLLTEGQPALVEQWDEVHLDLGERRHIARCNLKLK